MTMRCCIMLLPTLLILIAGVANFAMHRWMLESGHPVVEAAIRPIRRAMGRNASIVIEFGILIGALWMAQRSWFVPMLLYGVYTALNAATVALIKGPPRR